MLRLTLVTHRRIAVTSENLPKNFRGHGTYLERSVRNNVEGRLRL
jgi:hypothetical protein